MSLEEVDWNFDGVPDGELIACCYWEYARESKFIRERLQAYRKKWWCPGGELGAERTECAGTQSTWIELLD